MRYLSISRGGIFALSLGLAAALVGCGDASNTTTASTEPEADPEIDRLFVNTASAGAVSVIKSRTEAEAGTSVTVIGRVAGAEEPFSPYYATFVLADESLSTCDRRPDDGCQTPWDACCVQSDVIAESRISVQVVGSDGRPLEQSLKGVHGLSELDTLVVAGTVADGSTPENVILNATAIYLQKETLK